MNALSVTISCVRDKVLVGAFIKFHLFIYDNNNTVFSYYAVFRFYRSAIYNVVSFPYLLTYLPTDWSTDWLTYFTYLLTFTYLLVVQRWDLAIKFMSVLCFLSQLHPMLPVFILLALMMELLSIWMFLAFPGFLFPRASHPLPCLLRQDWCLYCILVIHQIFPASVIPSCLEGFFLKKTLITSSLLGCDSGAFEKMQEAFQVDWCQAPSITLSSTMFISLEYLQWGFMFYTFYCFSDVLQFVHWNRYMTILFFMSV